MCRLVLSTVLGRHEHSAPACINPCVWARRHPYPRPSATTSARIQAPSSCSGCAPSEWLPTANEAMPTRETCCVIIKGAASVLVRATPGPMTSRGTTTPTFRWRRPMRPRRRRCGTRSGLQHRPYGSDQRGCRSHFAPGDQNPPKGRRVLSVRSQRPGRRRGRHQICPRCHPTPITLARSVTGPMTPITLGRSVTGPMTLTRRPIRLRAGRPRRAGRGHGSVNPSWW